MARRKHTPEQVVKKLREAEVAMAEGGTVAQASRKIGGDGADLLPLASGVRRSADRPGATAQAAGDGERALAASGSRSDAGQPDTEGGGAGKLLSACRRRQCVERIRGALGVSERRACRGAGTTTLDAALRACGRSI